MSYECKIYDSKGKLKKVAQKEDVMSKLLPDILAQKSTEKSRNSIKNFKDGKEQKF